MRTQLDCLPCFLNQGLKAARLYAPDDETLHRQVLLSWSSRLTELDIDRPPPTVAGDLYRHIAPLLQNGDPFYQVKKRTNARALELLPQLQQQVGESWHPFRTALELSMIGNLMDSGVGKELDWEAELDLLDQDLDEAAYLALRQALQEYGQVMVLGDNAGEIVLDTILVQQLQQLGCRVVYAVRGSPIINDATMEDAEEAGMSRLCQVISSGVDTPGTVLERCSDDFLEAMEASPVIVSKGQGNLESLWNERRNIFYALKIKCGVVSDLTGLPEGSSALIHR
jgi:hypothetical protein